MAVLASRQETHSLLGGNVYCVGVIPFEQDPVLSDLGVTLESCYVLALFENRTLLTKPM